ncbi:uncharacterized protein LOC122244325, partial [Penaeus japonicus]|uniref:uncharacterized protein LOC122244325 n=1 Tax=Penaeus japonicus TaxID=27405 RepID=UPI001C711CA3
ESASTGPRVVLTRLDLDSSGRYKCEVISDWPEFHTADRSAILLVVELPEEKPRIHGPQARYHPGDRATLVCQGAPSHPPASLTWFINGLETDAEYNQLSNNPPGYPLC